MPDLPEPMEPFEKTFAQTSSRRWRDYDEKFSEENANIRIQAGLAQREAGHRIFNDKEREYQEAKKKYKEE